MASLAEMLAGLSGDPEAQGAANTSEAMAPAVNAHFGALAQQMADWANQQQAMNQRLQGQPLSQQALDPEGLQSAMSMALSTGPGAMETPAQKIMRVNNLMARNDMDAAKQGADNFFQNHTSGQIIPAYDAQGNPLPTGQPQGIRAYHASPYDFDAFDLSKVGTGQGAQSFGHGIYAAESPAVSGPKGSYDLEFTARNLGKTDLNQGEASVLRMLRDGASDGDIIGNLAGSGYSFDEALSTLNAVKGGRAKIYDVNINADPEQFLNWDKPLIDQPQTVQDIFGRRVSQIEQSGQPTLSSVMTDIRRGTLPGSSVYQTMGRGTQESATAALNEAGIPGIRYLDQGSRASGNGTNNYVVFDPKIIDIVKKYGLAGLLATGAATMGGGDKE